MKFIVEPNKNQSSIIINVIYGILILLCFMPFITPSIALILGILLSVTGIKHDKISKYTSLSLQVSIVLMGFGMNLSQVIRASESGFINTAISVFFVMLTGYILGKLFRVDTKTGILISTGTAICGGSAIAAISPIINAKNYQISFALVIVFVLNAFALIVFPHIGHYFNMSQEAFGNWAAIAIHDTSSVVGAGAVYGAKALEIATTVKLIRALWIIPLSLIIAFSQKEQRKDKIKIPWFIAFFVLSIIIAYLFPAKAEIFKHLGSLGKKGMVIALFLIGSNISLSAIKKAGLRSFLLGLSLWLIISISSFVALTTHL
jgi:uncharacterized integral membrane protein (TIGR00698 family)